jgi:hypothetical protein
MLVKLMPQGRQALINALITPDYKCKMKNFQIGSAFGFTPDLSSLDVIDKVYDGTTAQIYKTLVTEHEIIFTVYLPYYLDFTVGNIMIKLDGDVPFLWMIMDQEFKKGAINNEKHFAGDTYYQSMIIRFPYLVDRMDLSNISDFYASARPVSDLFQVPEVTTTEEDQLMLLQGSHFPVNNGRMVYATEVQGLWWGVPNMMDINDGDIGTIRGGRVGDGYYYDK